MSSSHQSTASESMMALHARETREARARADDGKYDSTWDVSSGGNCVRKSRASVGVRTEWRDRSTGSGEWRISVRRRCDCNCGGSDAK